MAFHDYVLNNAVGVSFRSDCNAALLAIVTNNSSATAPSPSYAFQHWADLSTNTMRIRNNTNTAWIPLYTLSTGLPLGVATSGVNSNITNLTGLNTSQSWSNVGTLEVGANVPAASGVNAIISYNASASANSYSRIWSRQRNLANNAWIDGYLEVKNDNNSYLVTGNQFLSVFTGNTSAFRWNNGIPEAMPSGALGGLVRYIAQGGSNRWDTYLAAGTTPTFCINNSNGAGVQLVWGNTAWQTLSDETEKVFDRDIQVNLNELNDYKLKIGRFKRDEEGVERIFFSAQDWQAKHPQIINENAEGKLIMSYGETAPILMAYMKLMLAEINSLKTELADLKKGLK
jgi:hypothetical protein